MCGGLLPVHARRHTDKFGEAGAERSERGAAHGEARIGDGHVAAAEQRHGTLDSPRHQIRIGRLAVVETKLTAEMTGGHVNAAGKRFDVERLRILPVHPIAHTAQQRKIA